MSGNAFVDCVMLFLICYAIFDILTDLSGYLIKRFCKYPPGYFLVLSLEHESATLENDIRCAVSKSMSLGCTLLCVAKDLDKNEQNTLWRLVDVYDHVLIMTPDEVAGILTSDDSSTA